MDRPNKKPSVEKDGQIITNHLNEALKDFSCLSSVGIAYGDSSDGVTTPLDIIVNSLIPVGDDRIFSEQYENFHERLHEEISMLLPNYADCWYVHEIIRFRLLDDKIVPAALIETFSCPSRGEHTVKTRKLI